MFWQHRRQPQTIPWEQAREHVICQWCGGIHSFVCPRVKHVAYDSSFDPPRIVGIEFLSEYARELWDVVIWPEEAIDAS